MDGGGFDHSPAGSLVFGAGDTLWYEISVATNEVDGSVGASAKVELNNGGVVSLFRDRLDDTDSRIECGTSGVLLDVEALSAANIAGLSNMRVLFAELAKIE